MSVAWLSWLRGLVEHLVFSEALWLWAQYTHLGVCGVSDSLQKIELPLMENVQTIPPPFVVRTILIYSRHAGQLQFNPSDAVSVRGVLKKSETVEVPKVYDWLSRRVDICLSSYAIFLFFFPRKCCSHPISSSMSFICIMVMMNKGTRAVGG